METGSCLCGTVHYNFDRASIISIGHCHCYDCQKASGSGKATVIFLPTDQLVIIGAFKTYTVVGKQGRHVRRGFCAECGSPFLTEIEEQPELCAIKAGSLDDSSWVQPDTNYWISTAQPWAPVDSSLKSFEQIGDR